MPRSSLPMTAPLSTTALRGVLAGERDAHRRQRDLVRASLFACPDKRHDAKPPRH